MGFGKLQLARSIGMTLERFSLSIGSLRTSLMSRIPEAWSGNRTLAMLPLIQAVAFTLGRNEAIARASSPLFEIDTMPTPVFFTCKGKNILIFNI
uniref:Uncharacterized protein n=1 Tax=Astyanax mexicanus TaxID=7994 RepID=A0A8B9HLM0_ASTMX